MTAKFLDSLIKAEEFVSGAIAHDRQALLDEIQALKAWFIEQLGGDEAPPTGGAPAAPAPVQGQLLLDAIHETAIAA